MNERIRELAVQTVGDFSKDEYWPFFSEELEKFARLIAQKCVTVVALHGAANFEDEGISWVCEKITTDITEFFEDPRKVMCSECGVDRLKQACPKKHTAAQCCANWTYK